ncbi:Fanconi anemia group B protein-like [Polyodon spathula]|uniref:Fanconi anemia group B protein-like n=1 Tax=Polyodon spathula TaxID=7913 RepID=UPI001B7ECAF1|nr:Fanconi anemia group B protein-like [Polyodon spathula]
MEFKLQCELEDNVTLLKGPTVLCMVTCMFVNKTEELGNQLKSTVVEATTNNQLIWFVGGIPKDICQLPFEGPCIGDIFFNFFYVASSWQGIQSLHIDDFVHCGKDQILLLFETSNTEDIFENYTFMDKVWQQVVDDSWVVGVKLTESACLSLDDVSLSLLMDQDIYTAPAVIQSQSNVLQFSKSPFSGSFPQCQTEPLAKKMRLASEKWGRFRHRYIEKSCSEFHRSQTQTVTTVTDLSPLLAFSNLNCSVMLHATINTIHKDSPRTGAPVVFQCSSFFSLEVLPQTLQQQQTCYR